MQLSKNQKELRGTYRKDRDEKEEFIPDLLEDVPESPYYWPEQLRELWKNYCNELLKREQLHSCDLEQLKAYIIACYMHDKAFQMLESQNYIFESTSKTGAPYQRANPWFSILSESSKQLQTLSAKFGFSPLDRKKLALEDKSEDNDPLSEILKLIREAE